MGERLRQIPTRILEWWKKFNTRQRAIMISSVAVVAIALAILAAVLSRPDMVILKECANTSEAADVKDLLDSNGYQYEMSDDGLVFSVDKKDIAAATLLLGENNITAYGYEWENLDRVFDGGFSSTEADKNKRYQLWMENDLEEKIETLAAVDDATVTLRVPEEDGTLIARGEESSAMVILSLNTDLEAGQPEGLARAIASALKNETTDNIVILDSDMNTLFSGGESDNVIGSASENLELKVKAQNQVAAEVRDAIMETNLYNSVSVVPNLDMDFTETETTDNLVYPAEGQDQGLPVQVNEYTSSATGDLSGVPGTDANDDNTTYMLPDGSVASQDIEDNETTYENSKRTTHSITQIGRPDYANSSVAVVASTYRLYSETELRDSGQLDGMTFDEFKAANEEKIPLDVDPTLITMISRATGIPEENVSMVAYEVPMFRYASEEGMSFMDLFPIILAALIMLMLGFVVFRSTRKEPEPEMEPELSVEALLESTKEAQQGDELEDIGFSEKSETRILIEKFVDENPEAAASLLRNWLNEEWE